MINKSSSLGVMMASFAFLFWGSNAESAIVNVPFTLITTWSDINGINVGDSTNGTLSYSDSALDYQGNFTYRTAILSKSISPLSGYNFPTVNPGGPGQDFLILGQDAQTSVGLNILDTTQDSQYNYTSIFNAGFGANNSLVWEYTIIGYYVNHYAGGTFQFETNTVPLPAAAWLFGSGLISLVGAACKRRSA